MRPDGVISSNPVVRRRWRLGGLSAALLPSAIALVLWPLASWLAPANIVMVFLLGVVVVAYYGNRRAGVVAAVLSVALFDFLYVPPQFSFAVNDIQYLLTFAVMLAVALTIGQLTNALRQRADDAEQRATERAALFGLAASLAGSMTREMCADSVASFLRDQLQGGCTVLVPDDDGHLSPLSEATGYALSQAERAAAQTAYDRSAEFDARQLGRDDGERVLLVLRGATRNRGVLAVAAAEAAPSLAGRIELLRAVADLLATALERIHYVEVAAQSDLVMRDERLRGRILAALSHDVRTPLTSIFGLAESIARSPQLADPGLRQTAQALQDQAMRLNTMVSNVLDMARLQSGSVRLRCEWQPLEEVVGASIRHSEPALGDHQVELQLPADLPLLHIDAVLMERVLSNLLENAAKYSPAGSRIRLSAQMQDECAEICVDDNGPGFAAGRESELFELFERGVSEGTVSGMGIGLAICKTIVEAHGGSIDATRVPPATDAGEALRGARVVIRLPRGTPPLVETEVGEQP